MLPAQKSHSLVLLIFILSVLSLNKKKIPPPPNFFSKFRLIIYCVVALIAIFPVIDQFRSSSDFIGNSLKFVLIQNRNRDKNFTPNFSETFWLIALKLWEKRKKNALFALKFYLSIDFAESRCFRFVNFVQLSMIIKRSDVFVFFLREFTRALLILSVLIFFLCPILFVLPLIFLVSLCKYSKTKTLKIWSDRLKLNRGSE